MTTETIYIIIIVAALIAVIFLFRSSAKSTGLQEQKRAEVARKRAALAAKRRAEAESRKD